MAISIGPGWTIGAGWSIGTLATQRAIFGYGTTATVTAITNLVTNTGVVGTDVTGVGTARSTLGAAGYGYA